MTFYLTCCQRDSLLIVVLLSFAQIFSSVTGVNVKEQNVKCNPQMIQVFFEFSEPFFGVVYAEKFYNESPCRAMGIGDKILVINIPKSTDPQNPPFCGVKVDKSRNEFHVTLVLSDSKDILVAGMRTFDILCRYLIEDFTMSLSSFAGINIRANNEANDAPPVIRGEGKNVFPLLDMSIRKGHGVEGQKLNSAAIGERITLDIFLSDAIHHDILVYGCVAHDGSKKVGNGLELVDTKGCAKPTEKVVQDKLQETREREGKHIFLPLYGFQFSTSDLVYFECQIKPCLGHCNASQCNGSTLGPTDKIGKLERDIPAPDYFNLLTKLSVHSAFQADRLHNEQFLRDDSSDSAANLQGPQPPAICVSPATLTALVSVSVLFGLSVLAVGIYLWIRSNREKRKTSASPVH